MFEEPELNLSASALELLNQFECEAIIIDFEPLVTL